MKSKQMIETIANIQYFVKTNVYGELIEDKCEYINRIRSVYKNMNEEEIKENLDEVKYLSVNAIKLNMRDEIVCRYEAKKTKAYEEYLAKCEDIELEKESKLLENSNLTTLDVNSIVEYIQNK